MPAGAHARKKGKDEPGCPPIDDSSVSKLLKAAVPEGTSRGGEPRRRGGDAAEGLQPWRGGRAGGEEPRRGGRAGGECAPEGRSLGGGAGHAGCSGCTCD